MKQTTYSTANIASVARMEHRGIRDLWLDIVRRFRGISPDSADEAPKRRTKPPKDGGQVPAYALHPGYAGWIPAFAGMTAFSCSHGKSSNNRQAGAALITSLIFLTVLTILGMSTLGTALLESRMAGNARDRNLAFQAAEIGLRDAELFIRDSGRITGNILVEFGADAQTDPLGTTCTFGFCHKGSEWVITGEETSWIDTPVWEEVNDFWDNAIQYQRDGATGKPVGSAVTTQLAINGPYVQPTAGLPLVTRQPEYLIESFYPKDTNAIPLKYYYRITVRGYGMRPGTRVMLQEVYTPN